MNNNNNNNINNSSAIKSESKNEITFWKVIHNQYLFSKIISYIPEIVDEIIEKNIQINNNDYSVNDTIKFKYIHSLNWMLTKNQLSLLKCKLQANEYIQIDKLSIESLLKSTSPPTHSTIERHQQQLIETNRKRKQDHLVESTTVSSFANTSTSSTSSTLYKEILQLLLDNKRVQIECIYDDLISMAIENDNLDGVRILSNQSVPIPINPTVVSALIRKDNQIKNQMIDILVNSNSFKSIQPTVSLLILQLKDKGVLITTSAGPPSNNSKCIKVNHDYDYRYILGIGELTDGTTDDDIYDYCCSQLNGNALEYLINKGARLIHSRRELDSFVLNLDRKTITNNQNSILKWIKLATSQTTITFCEDSSAFANQLFNIICRFSIISKHWYEAATLSINESFKSKMEYFPTWNPELHLFVPIDTIYEGDKLVKIDIKSTSTIDWMVSGYTETEYIIQSLKYYSFLNFKSYQLVDYLKPYFKKLEITNGSRLYSTPYRKAVKTCNIQVIKELDSREDIGFISISINQKDLYKLFKNNPIENVEQLLIHWYLNDYKPFKSGKYDNSIKFKYLIERIIYEQRNSKTINSGNDVLKRIRLNLNCVFQNAANEVIVSLIKINDINSLSLIVGNHQFKFNKSFYYNFKDLWNNGKQVNKYLYDKELNVYRVDNISINQLLSLINFWVSHLHMAINNSEFIEIGQDIHKSISIILNHLYSTLIQVRGVTFKDLLMVRRSLFNSSIEINHTTFHIFNYFFIKSPLITKYLMKASVYPMLNMKPIFGGDTDEEEEEEEEELKEKQNCGEKGQHVNETNTLKPKDPENDLYYNYNCKKHRTLLRSHYFTFDSILFTGLDCMLLNLVNQFTHSFEGAETLVNVNENLDATVDFLVEIGRIDILLQNINYTNSFCQLNNITNVSTDFKLSIKQLEMVFKSTTDLELVKSLFNVSKNVNYGLWFRACLYYENLQIINYLFDNHFDKSLFWTKVFNGKSENYNLISLEYIFSSYGDKLFAITQSTTDTKTNDGSDGNTCENYDYQYIFDNSFILGNVLLCDLLLKYFPNQFQITKSIFSKAQRLNKINILNYYQNVNRLNNLENKNNQ